MKLSDEQLGRVARAIMELAPIGETLLGPMIHHMLAGDPQDAFGELWDRTAHYNIGRRDKRLDAEPVATILREVAAEVEREHAVDPYPPRNGCQAPRCSRCGGCGNGTGSCGCPCGPCATCSEAP